MKFSAHKGTLGSALKFVESVIERKNTIPSIQNVLVEAKKGGEIRFLGTDLENWGAATIQEDVMKPGKVLVNARKLLEIVKYAGGDTISFSEEKEGHLSIQSAEGRFKLYRYEPDQFPQEVACPPSRFRLAATTYAKMVSAVEPAMTTEESRFQLNAVHFEVGPAGLKLVTTDSHRLAIAECEGQGFPETNQKALVPRKAVLESARLARDAGGGEIGFDFDENRVWFEINGRQLKGRCVAGQFPDYQRIIPTKKGWEAVIEREAFLHALRRVGIVAEGSARTVSIVLEKERLTLEARATETGEAVESFGAAFTGKEPFKFMANRTFLEQVDHLEGERVKLKVTTPDDQILFLPESPMKDWDFRLVVMPVRP